jgi:hypothetical protein
MKIASMKNEKPSTAKPRPNTEPKVAVKLGHKSPISKLRIVPVITPIANSAAMIFVQRWASTRYSGSPRAQVAPLGVQNDRAQRDPEADEGNVHRERQRLHLARLQQIGLLDGSEREGRQQSGPHPVIVLRRATLNLWSLRQIVRPSAA